MPELAHTYDCPDTNAILVQDPFFTTFTLAEAQACLIDYTAKINLPVHTAPDGGSPAFAYWEISVIDQLENRYTWWDFNLASGASNADIKTAIIDHLVLYVRKFTTSGKTDTPQGIRIQSPALTGARSTGIIKAGKTIESDPRRTITAHTLKRTPVA